MKRLFSLTTTAAALALTGTAPASPYSDAVLADAPVSYFQFEGNAQDSGSGDNDGNATAVTYPSVGGFGTGAYLADTVGGSISLGPANAASSLNTDLTGASGITVEFLVDFDSITSNGNVLSIQDSAGNQALRIRLTPNQVGWVIRPEDAGQQRARDEFNSGEIFNGQRHVAVVFDLDDSVNRLYVDGVESSTQAHAGFGGITSWSVDGNATDILIGAGAGGDFAGLVDELAVYGSALTQQQITDHFNAIPEPGSLALLGLGAALMVVRRR